MHRKHSVSFQIALLATVVLSCRTLCAQHVHAMSAGGTGRASLPVLVDGSKNPEQISDTLAYQHFFAAVAAHPAPTAQEQGRQSAQLAPLQLAAADREQLVTTLAAFRTHLDLIASAIAAAGTPDKLTSLQAQKTALVVTTLASLRQTLTADGASRLDHHIQTRVKAHIVIYGGAMAM